MLNTKKMAPPTPTGSSSTNAPVRFHDSDDDEDTPNPKAASDEVLARMNAEAIGTRLSSTCLLFIDAYNIFSLSLIRYSCIANNEEISTEFENYFPQNDHVTEVSLFHNQAVLCQNFTNSSHTDQRILRKVQDAMENGGCLMNIAAKALIHFYSGLSEPAKTIARKKTGEKFNIIQNIADRHQSAIRPRLPDDLRQDIEKRIKFK